MIEKHLLLFIGLFLFNNCSVNFANRGIINNDSFIGVYEKGYVFVRNFKKTNETAKSIYSIAPKSLMEFVQNTPYPKEESKILIRLNVFLNSKQSHVKGSSVANDQSQPENTVTPKTGASADKKQQNKTYLILAIFILLILNLYLIWLIYQNSKRIDRSNHALIIQNDEINTQKEELENLNELKNRFFSIVSHDLRSPLASLNGMLKLFEEAKFGENELKIFMNELEHNFKNTSGLLENLLMWGKSQMYGQTMQMKMIDLCAIADESIGLLKIQNQSKNLKTNNELASCFAYADEESVRVVMRNLLSNASKFTPVGGEVSIKSKKDRENLVISVNDSGIGMSPEQIAEVFSHQFYSTFGTNEEKGSGLGLMLSEELIRKNRGKFWVESEKGKGSSFYFTLPLVKSSDHC